MKPLTDLEIGKLKVIIWDELLDNQNYDQHTEVNRPKLLKEITRQSNARRPWPEYLPLQRLTAEQKAETLKSLVNQVSDEFDEPDPEVLKD